MGENLPSKAGDIVSIPGQGTKILHTATKEACAQLERLPHTAHPEKLPHTAHPEKLPQTAHPEKLPHTAHPEKIPHTAHPEKLLTQHNHGITVT